MSAKEIILVRKTALNAMDGRRMPVDIVAMGYGAKIPVRRGQASFRTLREVR